METTLLPTITQWLQLHSNTAYFLIFLFSFLESLVLMGLIFPGTLIMTAVGILVGSQLLPLAPVILFAALGAFFGDFISYAIGYHYRENLNTVWPFRSFPKVLEKGIIFFEKHGGKSVFIGRFIGPVRPIIPVIAGSLKMQTLKFILTDIVASIIWAVLYLIPGYVIGAASLALPPDAATRIIVNIILLLLTVFIAYWILQLGIVKITQFLDKEVNRLWKFLQRHPRGHFFYNLLKVSHIPEDHSQLGIAIFALLFWILLIVLTISVALQIGIYHINMPLYYFFRSAYALPMEKIMLYISYLGKPSTLIVFWLIILCWLSIRRFWFAAIHWLLVGILASGLSEVLKLFIASPRPLGLAGIVRGYSFPSGHTTMSTALFSFFAIMIARSRDEYFGWFCYILTGIICFLIGFSRVYLGAHWTTDVIGGFLVGLAISLTVAISFRRNHIKQQKLSELLLVAFLSLGLLWTFNYHHSYKTDVINFTPVWPVIKITENDWWQNGIAHEPLYRKNRLGKNIQTLNIQWLGSLPDIEMNLEQQGWKVPTKSVILHAINYFGVKNRSKVLPLFSAIYEDAKPRLLLSKSVTPRGNLLILRLWDSHVALINQTNQIPLPLWVGEVSYVYNKSKLFLTAAQVKSINPIKPRALDVLMQNLNNFEYKILDFSTISPLGTIQDIDWDGKILLIRTKLN